MQIRVLTLVLLLATTLLAVPTVVDRPIVTTAAGERYVAGQLVIKLDPSQRGRAKLVVRDGTVSFGIASVDAVCARWRVSDAMPLVTPEQAQILAGRYQGDLMYTIQFDADQDVFAVAAELEALPEVAYAEPNAVLRLDDVPNDPYYASQWHLARLQGPYAWGVAHGSPSVRHMAVDDGFDWMHPDLGANVWINTLEDLNGNGVFDSTPASQGGDRDGIDQDQNGYADDVIGWDFVSRDPTPMPTGTDDHGTHCYGTANAVTNNGVGVAAAAWNCRSIAVRCGTGGGVYLDRAVSAIYYGMVKGVFAISMSFGGTSQNAALRDACWDAWTGGCVLFGSAGNEYLEQMRYPACYNGVECVAASNQADMKADFSNWGTWVDVSAPGVAIYSTVPRAMGSYASMDGTSMAAPLAAGVACWIKSWNPTLNNQQVIDVLHEACDSMPDPLYAQGKLGAGRVSLGNVTLRIYYCNITLADWRINEPSGNGRPDPGETVSFIVTLANGAGWANATGVTADLTCTNPAVVIDRGRSNFGDIPGGSSANNSADSFVVTIPPDLAPQRLLFRVMVHSTPPAVDSMLWFGTICGSPRILLVDDDDGQNYENWYKAACDSIRALYDVHTVQTQGSPSAADLLRYPVVIWFTGNDSSTTLTDNDITALTAYLDAGKNLLLCGQSIAQDLNGHSFLSDYLHTSFVDDSTGKFYLVGIPGDPITRGDTMVLGGAGGAGNGLRSADGVRPIGGAFGCAYYRDYGDTTVHAVVRFGGAYKLVFFACAFEAIDQSPTRYLQKWTIIRRCLEWFGEPLPGIELEQAAPAAVNPTAVEITPNPFAVRAHVRFTAPTTGPVTLRVVATDGRVVHSETQQVTKSNRVTFILEGNKLVAGTYLIQIATPNGVWAQKTAVLR